MADKSFGVKELNLLNASGTPTVTSPNNLNLNANTVAISTSCTIGNNLTVTSTTNSANLNVTGIGTLTRAFATDLSVSGVTTITVPANANPHSSWDVVNNGSSAYRFTGPGQDGAEDNPNIYLVRGQRYVFKMNASGHPFQIRVANAGAAYSDGVTNNGSQTGNIIFNVQHDAPAQLFYQCTSHSGMVGNIYIVGGPQVVSGVITATSFSGSGANLTSLPAQATIANNGNDRIITGGSGVNLNGEANLQFDGTDLYVSDNIKHLGDPDTLIEFATDTITFDTAGNETLRITSTGNLLVGATAVEDWDGSRSHKIQVRGDSSNNAGISALITANDDNPSELVLGKSRSTGNTIVGSADDVGQVRWSANDGAGFHSIAYIRCSMDGTPGSNDLPSNLRFGTSADGGTTVTERLRIDSSGRTLINTTAVTNTNDQLTVKRPASGFGEMSMTVDANTSSNSAANAFIFTKSKHTYWNGYGFQSSHGHIGAIVGMRDSTGMNTSHKIRIEIGGTGINASEEKTWDFLNTGDLSISDGNLVVASGHGIDFSATGGGSNTSNESELFDDYEEGSCAVLIHDAAGSNISVTNNTFKYTKIGNRVFIAGSFVFAETGSKNGGLMILYQLPFVPAQNLQATGTYWYDGTSDGADVTGVIYVSTNSSGQGYLKQSTTIGQPSNNKYLTFNEIQKNSSRPLYASFSYNVS